MSPRTLFFILLIIGIVILFVGKKIEKGAAKVILMILSALMIILSAFGIVVSFL